MRIVIQTAIFLFACFVTSLVFATSKNTFPKHLPVPGGVARLVLDNQQPLLPQVFYEGRRVLVREENNKWVAIIGLSLSAKPGQHAIKIEYGQMRYEQYFKVANKKYPVRNLTITGTKTEPSKQELQHVKVELKKIKAAYQHWSERSLTEMQLQYPANGVMSSPFGVRSILNGKLRKRPHNGIDIAAPVGTAVNAPIAGVVVAVGQHFFSGNDPRIGS